MSGAKEHSFDVTISSEADIALDLPDDVGGLGAAGEVDSGATADGSDAGDLQDPGVAGAAVESERRREPNTRRPLVETGTERLAVEEAGM